MHVPVPVMEVQPDVQELVEAEPGQEVGTEASRTERLARDIEVVLEWRNGPVELSFRDLFIRGAVQVFMASCRPLFPVGLLQISDDVARLGHPPVRTVRRGDPEHRYGRPSPGLD